MDSIQSKPRTRRRTLWLCAGFALTLFLWTSLSALSPYRGWFGHAATRVFHAYQRLLADAPCEMEPFSVLELDGIQIPYPDCYEERLPFNVPGEWDYSSIAIIDSRELSAFAFSVSRFPPNTFKGIRQLKVEGRSPTCEVSMVNGWEVAICEPEFRGEYLTAEILGDARSINVEVLMPRHLQGTELDQFVREYFGHAVDQICMSRAPTDVLPKPGGSGDAI